jgi:hypothetical protein
MEVDLVGEYSFIMSIVALVYCKEDLAVLKSKFDFKEIILIAATPEADFWLREESIVYKSIEDYYDEVQLNQKAINTDQIISNLATTIDREFFATEKFFSAFDFFFYLKTTFDQLSIIYAFCKGMLAAENPKLVLLPSIPQLQNSMLTIDSKAIFFGAVLSFLQQKKIGFEFYVNMEIKMHNGINQNKPSIAESITKIHNYLSIKKAQTQNLLYSCLKNKNSPIIFIAQHWDFEVCNNLNRFFKVIWLQHIKDKLLSTAKSVAANQSYVFDDTKLSCLRNFFQFDDVCLYEFIKPKLTNLIYDTSRMFRPLCIMLEKQFIHKKVNVLIAAAGQSIEILAAIKTAKLLGIPVIWGQHGGLYGYGDFPIERFLSKNYTHYFLYSKPVSKMVLNKPFYVVSDSKLLDLYKSKRA